MPPSILILRALGLGDFLTGGFDAGYPLTSGTYTEAHNLRMTFRVGANF